MPFVHIGHVQLECFATDTPYTLTRFGWISLERLVVGHVYT